MTSALEEIPQISIVFEDDEGDHLDVLSRDDIDYVMANRSSDSRFVFSVSANDPSVHLSLVCTVQLDSKFYIQETGLQYTNGNMIGKTNCLERRSEIAN